MPYSPEQFKATVEYILNDAFKDASDMNKKRIGKALYKMLNERLKGNAKEIKYEIAVNEPLFKDFFDLLETLQIRFPKNYRYILKIDGTSIATHHQYEIIFEPLRPAINKNYRPLLDDLNDALKRYQDDKAKEESLSCSGDEDPLVKYTYNPKRDIEEMDKHYKSYSLYEPDRHPINPGYEVDLEEQFTIGRIDEIDEPKEEDASPNDNVDLDFNKLDLTHGLEDDLDEPYKQNDNENEYKKSRDKKHSKSPRPLHVQAIINARLQKTKEEKGSQRKDEITQTPANSPRILQNKFTILPAYNPAYNKLKNKKRLDSEVNPINSTASRSRNGKKGIQKF